MKSKNFQHPTTVMLDERTKQELTALCQQSGLSQGLTIRQAIRSQYMHRLAGRPTCADGSTCHCPHTHTYPPSILAAGGRAAS